MRFITLFLTILWAIFVSACNQAEDSEKPNLIIILTDDQGYADVGFNGCEDIPTPHMDRIAKNGVLFTDGYVTYPVCGPSRAGLITGRYQDRFGFGRNPLFAANDSLMGLALSEETIADFLGREGYVTKAIGKWHLGAHEDLRPLQRGFDEFYGFLSGGHRYFPEEWTLEDISQVKSQYEAYKTKLLDNDRRIDENEYITDAFSREAVTFVEQHHATPFFLYLAYNAPHGPLQATEKYLERFGHIKDPKRKTYAAMVSAVDDGVGRLLDKLDALGELENTMIFFLSDNGGPINVNGSRNTPLRDGKGSLYEGGVRVPFAMMWQEVIREPVIFSQPVSSLDIAATFAARAGAKPANKLDGTDLVPFITGKKEGSPHEALFWRKFDSGDYAVRNGKFKLVNYRDSQDALFNLKQDIEEDNDISDPEITNQLLEQMEAWKNEMMDPVFLGLMQGKQYDRLHPDRYDVERY
jgi:arylsulfatase A-like enzyme